MDTKKASNNMISRISVYLNYIKSVSLNTKYISAKKIANELKLGEVTVRKDLALVSNGGRKKVGYFCSDLMRDIEDYFGIQNIVNAVIIGKKDAIEALLSYEGFEKAGVKIIAGFGTDCSKKKSCGNVPVYPLSQIFDMCKKQPVSIVILMDEVDCVQEICEQLISMGAVAILNCTSASLQVPQNVIICNENIVSLLMKIRMQLKNNF